MNATRQTDWLLLTTGIALAGTMAQQPAISLAAALSALTVLGGPRAGRVALASVAGAGRATTPSEPPSHLMFRRFRRGDATSSRADESKGKSKGGADGSNDGSQSYEEFAAHLDDAEEISFMPHYASDTVDSRSSTQTADAETSQADSLLTNDLKEVEQLVSKLPVPRRFALGTVAIIRRLLEPDQVEKILLEQRRYPRLRFGDVAVQLGLLTDNEVQELLVAQDEGLFSDEEISDARKRLAAYHTGA